jgi:hypothetical protein
MKIVQGVCKMEFTTFDWTTLLELLHVPGTHFIFIEGPGGLAAGEKNY